VDVGERGGHDPEDSVLRRFLGKPCRSRENNGEPEQKYGKIFFHRGHQENEVV
jgi:hypothetical protein